MPERNPPPEDEQGGWEEYEKETTNDQINRVDQVMEDVCERSAHKNLPSYGDVMGDKIPEPIRAEDNSEITNYK